MYQNNIIFRSLNIEKKEELGNYERSEKVIDNLKSYHDIRFDFRIFPQSIMNRMPWFLSHAIYSKM